MTSVFCSFRLNNLTKPSEDSHIYLTLECKSVSCLRNSAMRCHVFFCFVFLIEPIESIKLKKRSGQRMDPWGTPQKSKVFEDVSPNVTEKLQQQRNTNERKAQLQLMSLTERIFSG